MAIESDNVNMEPALQRELKGAGSLAVVQWNLNSVYGNGMVSLQTSGIYMNPRPNTSQNTLKVKQTILNSALEVQPLTQIRGSACHDVYETGAENLFCHICQVRCLNAFNLKLHLGGQKHRNKLEEVKFSGNNSDIGNGREWCKVCKIVFMDKVTFMQHLRAQQHKDKLQENKFKWKQGTDMMKEKHWCQLCRISCLNDYNFKLHLEGKRHALQLQGIDKNKKTDKNEVVTKHNQHDNERRMNSDIVGLRHWCEVCKVCCTNEYSFKLHLGGKRHASQCNNVTGEVKRAKREARVMKVDLQDVQKGDSEIIDQQNWCIFCKVWCINAYNLKLHLEGKRHAMQLQTLDNNG